MSRKALAVKYRPHTWDDVVEQDNTKVILKQQLASNEVKNAYLFVGGAGTGKTTCARIFANEINNHEGTPIELDAASNSGVEDVREIIKQAKTSSLDSEYKIFIVDECHSLSNTAWQAFLKLIEEPPVKSIFIFCTTNPEKIPKTILSRVQRYDFKRISQKGIIDRLAYILHEEGLRARGSQELGINYIAKLSDGGMRDAITLMDKCLSYDTNLSMENVVKALGVSDYATMIDLTDSIINKEQKAIIKTIENIHSSGLDLKQFIRQYINFILDIKKWLITEDFSFINLPQTDDIELVLKNIKADMPESWDKISDLLETLIKINSEVKYDSSPKYLIEAMLLEEVEK